MNVVPLPPRDANSTPNATFVYQLYEGLPFLKTREGGFNGWATYICNTLDDCAYQLKELIQARLDTIGPKKANGYRNTFDDWAERYGDFTYLEIQDGRRRWMLDLIEEFS